MAYRMFSSGASAGDNVVELIKKELEENGSRLPNLNLDFVGFQAEPGTKFFLNDMNNEMKVPETGYFITPYNGEYYLRIKSLVFVEDFEGSIYYII